MIRRTKYLLVFSLIYWLVVIVGVVLFSVSFQKVPIGYYGLKANFFSPDISADYYTPGLYDAGVGFYFILFPSTKQFLLDNKVTVINQNLQKLVVTYTLCYRIDPSKIYYLYKDSGYDYPLSLSAAANNIISSAFMALQQEQSRVTVQTALTASLLNSTNKIAVSLNNSVTVQGLFINDIQFPAQLEVQYQDSTALSDTYQQSYETTQLQFQKTRMQVQNTRATIELLKQQFRFSAEQAYALQFANTVTTDATNYQAAETDLSAMYHMKRIWTVICFLLSTIMPLAWFLSDRVLLAVCLMITQSDSFLQLQFDLLRFLLDTLSHWLY